MGKLVYPYAGYTTAQIKSRASYPPSGNITDNTTNLDCIKLKKSDLKVLLGETTDDVIELLTSANRNIYSKFVTGFWKLQGGSIVFSNSTPSLKWGDMACYNHSAPAPTKSNFDTNLVIVSGGGNVTVKADIHVGEIDWRETFFTNIDAVEMVVRQGASIRARQEILYDNSKQQDGFEFSEVVYMSGVGTLTVSFYFNEDGVNVASIPNISSHNISVSQIYLAEIGTVELDSTLQAAHPTWELVYNELLSGIDQPNSEYTLNTLAIDSNDDEGDVTRFGMELYARLNGGKWYLAQSGLNLTSFSGVTITDDALPFTVTYNDIVDFVLSDM